VEVEVVKIINVQPAVVAVVDSGWSVLKIGMI
jgi:hypothetical protein